MLYKENWEQAKANLTAWWHNEDFGRPAVLLTAPKRTPLISTWNPWMLINHLDDINMVVREFETYCQEMFFGAESVPDLGLNFGPGIPAAYFGIEPRIAEDTVWFEPDHPMTWDEILQLQFDPNNTWWRKTLDTAKTLVELGKEKFFVSNTDLNAEYNILAHIRNNQKLLTDLIDCPENVVEMDRRIHDMWHYCYNELTNILMPHNGGTLFWMGIWCPEKSHDTQCDFSAMISPRMFKRFILSDIEDTCRRIPRTIYHLDGPGELPHLDILLDIDELDGIQWVPGAGQPDCTSPVWFDMYRKIQDRGKLLVCHQVPNDPDAIRGMIQAVSRKGLLIAVDARSQSEADDMLKHIEAWSHV